MEPRSWLLRSGLLGERSGIVHVFTARGTHGGPDVDLRDRPGDPERACRAWERVMTALGASAEQVAQARQVHGRQVLEVDEPSGPLAVVGEADALITTTPGLWLAIRTADCVPILLAAPDAVAAVHAGWRGVAAQIVLAAVDALVERARCTPGEVVAAIGPHASVEHYVTGPDVVLAREQAGRDPRRISKSGPRGRLHTDLERAVRDQLERRGVRALERVGGCTLSDERYFSHRRLGPGSGRQAALIALLPNRSG